MQTLLRAFALVALALALPACATPKKSSASCCSTDDSCHAPAVKKKAN